MNLEHRSYLLRPGSCGLPISQDRFTQGIVFEAQFVPLARVSRARPSCFQPGLGWVPVMLLLRTCWFTRRPEDAEQESYHQNWSSHDRAALSVAKSGVERSY